LSAYLLWLATDLRQWTTKTGRDAYRIRSCPSVSRTGVPSYRFSSSPHVVTSSAPPLFPSLYANEIPAWLHISSPFCVRLSVCLPSSATIPSRQTSGDISLLGQVRADLEGVSVLH
jgi:hypothetical protein